MDRAKLVLVAYHGDDVSVHPLERGTSLSIGRADDNDIPVNDVSVSRKHCVIRVGDRVELEDLGGPNGTFVDKFEEGSAPGETRDLKPIKRRTVELEVGDRIAIGMTFLALRHARVPPGAADSNPGAVIRDDRMVELYAQANLAAQANINVLVMGETGVGKEVLARSIHDRSPRATKPFLGINCAAISESLLESELFGHEKGSFTGALQTRAGLFETADGGTVFLDEIGELSTSIQVKLLRVLEDRKVLRVGGRQAREIDVRFIAATNRDLEAELVRGGFREDLYFRLNGFVLAIPPLRERRTEIQPLAEMFVATASRQLNRRIPPTISGEALRLLEGYAWPGNVRELRNAVERAVVLCSGPVITPDQLPPRLADQAERPSAPPSVSPPAATPGSARDIDGEIQALERQRIVAALEQCAGNQTRAAELLGVSRRTLATWLARHRIPRPRKSAE